MLVIVKELKEVVGIESWGPVAWRVIVVECESLGEVGAVRVRYGRQEDNIEANVEGHQYFGVAECVEGST